MGEYPTKEDIEFVKKYGLEEFHPLLEHLENIWWAADWGFKLAGKATKNNFEEKVLKLELHTGGWSGNEDIIEALQGTSFWILCWEKTVRGGHYYFEIPVSKETKDE